MIERILEIGAAVHDIASASDPFVDLLGAVKGNVFPVPAFSMNMCMLRVGNVDIELMESVQTGGLIHRFIEKRGQGLHHIAFEVQEIGESMHRCREHGVEIIGHGLVEVYGIKVAFLDPKKLGGVLVELIQGNPTWVSDRCLPDTLQEGRKIDGVGAQGIVEIGILVEDMEMVAGRYQTLFMTNDPGIVEFDHFRSATLTTGNVVLNLMETASGINHLTGLTGSHTAGLHHIALKVENLTDSMAYLKESGVHFAEAPDSPLWDEPVVFIHPRQLCGIPVRLTEKIPAGLTGKRKT